MPANPSLLPALRLALIKWLLPRGYAIWTYGEVDLDEPIYCNAFDD